MTQFQLDKSTIKQITEALKKGGIHIVGLGKITAQKTKHPLTGDYVKLYICADENIKEELK